MKKLIYNENTKLIDIVECEEIIENKNEKEKKQGRLKRIKEFFKSKIEKRRESLNKNKVFFEVFSYLFVGIIISYVGWQTNIRTAEIYQRQLEILVQQILSNWPLY